MAVERPISQQIDFISKGHAVRKNLIKKDGPFIKEDTKQVPNHILDTKHFLKLSHNAVIQAEPAAVHFAGFEPGRSFIQTLRLINLSSECQNMHIIPPSSKFFKAWYKKKQRLVPGMALEVTIEFTPDEWRYYYDCIRIHCQDADNLLVPIHGYPVMDMSDFPSVFSFPPTPVLQSKTKEIPLRCKVPVDFEFNVTFPQPNPAFRVDPLSGVIPGQGEVALRVTFTPAEFSTAVMKIQLNISQFNSKPHICVVTGNSMPGIEEKEVTSNTEATDFERQLDPHSISPLGVSRKKRHRKPKPKLASTGALQKDGIRFPSNLDSQHSVNSVLIQQAGKMSFKELKAAIRTKNDTAVNRYQLKEAEYDLELKEDVRLERKNELRWQVHLGHDQISQSERDEVIEARSEATSEYHYRRGDPVASIEYDRTTHNCIQRRVHRSVTDIPSNKPQFDLFSNDSWALRHRTINRFRGAVNKVILRLRAERKIPFIRKLVRDFKRGELQDDSVHGGGASNTSVISDLPFSISADVIRSQAFPTYTAPDYKDDMAPDSLGIVPCKSVPLEVKKQVPFLDLKVPQQYKLMGYRPHSARDAGFGYIPPRLVRPLRAGAEDEIIQPADVTWSDQEAEPVDKLVPPPGLFKSTEYPPLHIFNPAPGLQVFLPPVPYAETDPDFHLNPLPQYTHRDPANKHGVTLKKFLDREDVIKGVMHWKKFPSQGLVSLANTPTLMNVWVPRWTDPFNKNLLPSDVPALLDALPEEDRVDIITEQDEEETIPDEASPVLLTPSMVNAEFAVITAPETPSDAPREKREKREKDLELFLQKTNNKLGERIQARIKHMNSLLNNQQLKLE